MNSVKRPILCNLTTQQNVSICTGINVREDHAPKHSAGHGWYLFVFRMFRFQLYVHTLDESS